MNSLGASARESGTAQLSRVKRLMARLPEEAGLLAILISFCGILVILSPYFLTFNNITNVLQDVAVTGIVSIGMTYVIISGGIDLSVGSTLALAAVVSATYAKHGHSVPSVILVAVLVGLVVGLLNGLAITLLHVPPLVTTLAMLSMARGAELFYGKANTIFGFGDRFDAIGGGSILQVPNLVSISLVLFVIGAFVLARTPYGRRVYAVGGSPRAARIVGISTRRVMTSVYVISGVLSGIAGVLLVSRLDSAPSILGTNLELQSISAVVIGGTSLTGGKGGVWGTLIGVLLIGVINNALNLLNVSPYYQQFVQGAVLFVAVAIDVVRRRGTPE